MTENFIPVVLEEKEVWQVEDGTRAVWRLMSTPDGIGLWKPYHVNANGDVLMEPAWMPLPGSQYDFLESPAFETLYEGTRGPGKTMTLLMDFASGVGKGYGKAWRGILFRRTYGDLDDVVRKVEEVYPKVFPGFMFKKSKADYACVWPDGEQLLLRHMLDENDYEGYHGHEYPWIAFEELTQWDNDKAYKLMFSCCRPTAPGIPCRVRATTNPYGVGHCVPYGEVLTSFRGWVPIQNVKVGESVVSIGKDGIARNTEVSDVVIMNHSGDLIVRDGRGLHMAFTEQHRLPHLNTDQTSFTLKPFTSLPGQANIKRCADGWVGQNPDEFVVPILKTRKRKLDQPKKLLWGGYVTLMGWFLSEGCTVDRDKAFAIAQTKEPNRSEMKIALRAMGFEFGESPTQFLVHATDWWAYLKQFGKCRDKFIPLEIKQSETKYLRMFFDAAMMGDGHWTDQDAGHYYTTSQKFADDMAEIAVKLGYCVHVSSRQREGRIGLAYDVSFSLAKPVQLNTGNHVYDVGTDCQNVNVDRIHFEGEVYCLTVPETETFFIRQNGCVWLSGNSWVKKRFKLPHFRSKIIKNPGEVPRVAIRGHLSENFLLLHTAPNYPAQIMQAATNPAQAAAWIEGSWDVNAGGMVDDLWDAKMHVLPDFPAKIIPRSWRITRAYDHGQSHPFAVGWWLESSGEPIKWNGQEFGRIRGDLILYNEWYGTTGEEQTGVRMEAGNIAQGILDREDDMGLKGRVLPGPADTEIWSKDSRGTGRAPIDDMMDKGVYWERADKTPGSRKRGWQMLRSRLTQAKPGRDGTREKPGMFVCERCKYWLTYVPTMPRDKVDPDDVPEKYEDHMGDMTRYRLNWVIPGMWRRNF